MSSAGRSPAASSAQKVFENAADMEADIESDEEVSAKMLSEHDAFD